MTSSGHIALAIKQTPIHEELCSALFIFFKGAGLPLQLRSVPRWCSGDKYGAATEGDIGSVCSVRRTKTRQSLGSAARPTHVGVRVARRDAMHSSCVRSTVGGGRCHEMCLREAYIGVDEPVCGRQASRYTADLVVCLENVDYFCVINIRKKNVEESLYLR